MGMGLCVQFTAIALALSGMTTQVLGAETCDLGLSLEAPFQVEVNSATNPDPYQVELSSETSGVLFSISVCLPGQRPGVNCEINTDFQSSGTFDIQIFDEGLYTIYGLARHIDCVRVSPITQPVYFFEPSEIALPDAITTFELSDAWQFAVRWPSVAANKMMAAYHIVITPASVVDLDPITLVVPVVDPLNEPSDYVHTVSFANSSQDRKSVV